MVRWKNEYGEVMLEIDSGWNDVARVAWTEEPEDWFPLEEAIRHRQVGQHILTNAEYRWLCSDKIRDTICEAIFDAEEQPTGPEGAVT